MLPLLLERAWSGANGRPSTTTRSHSLVDEVPSCRGRSSWLRCWSIPASMAVGYSGFRLPGGASARSPTETSAFALPWTGEPVRARARLRASYAAVDAAPRPTLGRPASQRTEVAPRRLRPAYASSSTTCRSIAAGEELAGQARAAGLEPTLERDPGGLSRYARRP